MPHQGGLARTHGRDPCWPRCAITCPGDVGQTEDATANLVSATCPGAELSDVVKTTVFVARPRRDDLAAAWRVVRNRFGDHDARPRCWAWQSWAMPTNSSKSRPSPHAGNPAKEVRTDRSPSRVGRCRNIPVYRDVDIVTIRLYRLKVEAPPARKSIAQPKNYHTPHVVW
jgi:hypothetical protein